MTAKEIRDAAKAIDVACKTPEMERLSPDQKAKAMLTIVGTLAFSMVCEVAAQFAELNERLDEFEKKLTSNGCIDVMVRDR